MARSGPGGGGPGAAQRAFRAGGGRRVGPIATYRDEAVVLRKLDYGEADRIYTLLTREHGKLGALARGVRKSTSKLSSSLELFARIDVQLARGHNLDVVTQVVRVPGPRLGPDLGRTAYASLVAELADLATEDRHPLEGIFELVVFALEDITLNEPRPAAAWFLWAALNLLGYAPDLMECDRCRSPLQEQSHPFSPTLGGFLCPACAPAGVPLVPPAALKVLRVMARSDIDLYRRLKLDDGLLAAVEGVLEAQMEHHLDRRLRSLRFLRQMRISA
ncbi:MAG: DNA repair protein RecO [Candidatus Dormibacteraceae bacterium]